jgi:hypothetical protein
VYVLSLIIYIPDDLMARVLPKLTRSEVQNERIAFLICVPGFRRSRRITSWSSASHIDIYVLLDGVKYSIHPSTHSVSIILGTCAAAFVSIRVLGYDQAVNL